MMRLLRDQRGLTLIELLVVVLLLGILAAVALPNYLGAENDARIAVDRSNVGAINAALALYKVKNGSCPGQGGQPSFSAFLSNPTYFPDGAPQDPIDGTSILPGQPGYDDYPADYDATNCRLKRD